MRVGRSSTVAKLRGSDAVPKGFMARGGLRKVAERLVRDFKDAVEKTR